MGAWGSATVPTAVTRPKRWCVTPMTFPMIRNIPDNVFLSRIGWADSSPDGALVIDGSFSPLFRGAGQPYDPGQFLPQSGFLAVGGDNTPVNDYQGDLQAATEHHSFNGLFSFELTPDIRFFAEGKYVKSDNFTIAQPFVRLFHLHFGRQSADPRQRPGRRTG